MIASIIILVLFLMPLPITANANSDYNIEKISTVRFFDGATKASSISLRIIKKYLKQGRPLDYKIQSGGVNPIVSFCEIDLKGLYVPFQNPKDKTKGSESTCLFKDDSFFFLWDLDKALRKTKSRKN